MMKVWLIIWGVVICFSLNAQDWTNLAYSPDQPGLEENPLKGFADLFGPTNDFPRSINGDLFGLNEVMKNLDDYDWSVIDNFIARNKREGNFSYLQVNINPGPDGNNRPRSFMPAYLNGKYETVVVDGPVADICPDWNDPDILEAMLNFIDAFGARYDTLPEVFMVHLGLYGIYGEWQIGDAADIAPEFEMTQANRLMIANAFKQAFPNTNLLARYPEHMPNPALFGYSDGLFFSQSVSPNTFFNHFYFDNTLRLYNAGENWRNQVIGGEIDPCIQPVLWKNWPNVRNINCDPNNPSGQSVDVQDVQRTIERVHPTFLFSHHVFTQLDPVATPAEWSNAIRAQKLMGYTFYVDQSRITALDGFPFIEVNIQNTGVAPMYANWDVEIGAVNMNTNEFQSLGIQKWNLNIIQPDQTDNYRSLRSSVRLEDGEYSFVLRVVNPMEEFSSSAPPVRFANETQDANGMEGWLTLGQLLLPSDATGFMPIPVTGISVSPPIAALTVGDQLRLTATIAPEDATSTSITWSSDQPGRASVSTTGLVTAGPAYGVATISAYAQGGGLIGQSEFFIDPKSVEIPAVIEAEDYIDMNGIVSGFGKLGFIDDRDWMDYSVTVTERGSYVIDIYASCPSCSDDLSQQQTVGIISIRDADGNLLDEVRLPQTNSFNDFEIATSSLIKLPVGTYIFRLEAKEGAFDVDKVGFRRDETVSIADYGLGADVVSIYPNPTNGSITLEIGEGYNHKSDLKVEITNVYGGTLQTVVENNGVVDLSHLESGIYFLIIDLDGKKAIKKVVKS